MKNILEEVLKLITEEELPLIKVFGSSLLFENSSDIDIAVYDKQFALKLKEKAFELKLHRCFHIIPMNIKYWNNLKNLSSFTNICLEWYMGKTIFGDNFNSSKIIERNTLNGPFRTESIIQRTKNKLLKRGYMEKDENETKNV